MMIVQSGLDIIKANKDLNISPIEDMMESQLLAMAKQLVPYLM